MDHEALANKSEEIGSHHLNRRSILRTAAHAAWVVPTIQIISAAPALAAASDTLVVNASATNWGTLAGFVYLDVVVQVDNPAPGTLAAGGVVVSLVTFAPGATVYGRNFASTGGAWTGGTLGVDTSLPYQFTRSTIDNGGSASITIRVGWAEGSAPAPGASVTISGTVSTATAGFNPTSQPLAVVSSPRP